MALATSEASARVGRGFSVMDSSICVAVITGRRNSRARLIIVFCTTGTRSGFISTPRSPRADHHAIRHTQDGVEISIASGFSSSRSPECLCRRWRTSVFARTTSFGARTKLTAM